MNSSITLTPIPSFTIKAFHKETKVFINITCSDLIPAPSLDILSLHKPSLDLPSQDKIPLSLQGPSYSRDKNNLLCTVYSCCFHKSVIEKCLDVEYKNFVIELAVQWVSEKFGMELLKISLPRLGHFGVLIDHVVKKKLITEQRYWIQNNKIYFDLSFWDGATGTDIKLWIQQDCIGVLVEGVFSERVKGNFRGVEEGVYDVGKRLLIVSFSEKS